ncbi:MATE family efflux transporter [Shimazuella kribbensis]|uniref:MATE family efflux transporter n=1 Tax=Shimazuella kribbensis TaxID=139808 RepID=UPI00041A6995|nr:MATE family efflux transporter [Shimazuella kribbensis]
MSTPYLRNLFKQAWPNVLTQMCQLSLNLVDALFVAKINLVAVSAVGIGATILATIGTVAFSVSNSTSAFVAQSKGGEKLLNKPLENQDDQIRLVAVQGLILTTVLGLLGGIAIICFAHEMVSFFSVDAQTSAEASTYLRVVGGCSVLSLLMQTTGAILRGVQDSRAVFQAGWRMNLIHLPLDYLFIFLLHQGVRGAAWATVISTGFGAVYMWRKMLKKVFPHVGFIVKVDWTLQKKIIQQSLPNAASLLAGWFVTNTFNFALLKLGGEDAFAANRIAWQIKNAIAIAWIVGFSSALIPLVGEQYGMKNYKNSLRYCNWAIGVMSGVCGLLLTLELLTGKWIIQLFTQESHITHMSYWMLMMLVIMDSIWGIYMCAKQALNGVTYNKWLMLTSFFSTICYCTSVWIAIANQWTYQSLYFIEMGYWSILCIFAILRFYGRGWIPKDKDKLVDS